MINNMHVALLLLFWDVDLNMFLGKDSSVSWHLKSLRMEDVAPFRQVSRHSFAGWEPWKIGHIFSCCASCKKRDVCSLCSYVFDISVNKMKQTMPLCLRWFFHDSLDWKFFVITNNKKQFRLLHFLDASFFLGATYPWDSDPKPSTLSYLRPVGLDIERMKSSR